MSREKLIDELAAKMRDLGFEKSDGYDTYQIWYEDAKELIEAIEEMGFTIS